MGSLRAEPAAIRLGYPEARRLRLRLEPSRPLDKQHGTPTVFVHLVNGDGELVRTFDHPLPGPWTPGTPVDDPIEIHQSALADPLPPGAYRLDIGLYDDSVGYRWPLQADGDELSRRAYGLVTVEVVEPPEGPRFRFFGEWLGPEPGTTKQVVARRCLGGTAVVRVAGGPEDGTVVAQIYVDPTEAGRKSAGAAPLLLAGGCDESHPKLTEPGMHVVQLPVVGEKARAGCGIRFVPSGEHRICLETLAWRPDSP